MLLPMGECLSIGNAHEGVQGLKGTNTQHSGHMGQNFTN